jgi:hypothetical protein
LIFSLFKNTFNMAIKIIDLRAIRKAHFAAKVAIWEAAIPPLPANFAPITTVMLLPSDLPNDFSSAGLDGPICRVCAVGGGGEIRCCGPGETPDAQGIWSPDALKIEEYSQQSFETGFLYLPKSNYSEDYVIIYDVKYGETYRVKFGN